MTDNPEQGYEDLSDSEREAWREYDARQQTVQQENEARAYQELMNDEGRPIDTDPVIEALDPNHSLVQKYTELEMHPGYQPTSWRPISALQYYDRDPEPPAILLRTDGVCMIYAGMSHSFVGHFESLKSWAALLAVKDVVMRLDAKAFYLDMESGPFQFWRRVKALGIPLEKALSHIGYFSPREMLWNPRTVSRLADSSARRDFFTAGAHYQPILIVIDGVTEFCAMHGLDISEATDISLYQKMILKGPWSGEVATLEVDHVAKDSNSRDFKTPLGSQQKAAGIDGATFYFQSVAKGGAHKVAKADIFLIKDREGFLNDIAVGDDDRLIGQFILDEQGARIEPPVVLSIGEGLAEFQDTAEDLEGRVLQVVAQKGPISIRGVIGHIPNEKGKNIRRALQDLEQSVLIHKDEGSGLFETYDG